MEDTRVSRSVLDAIKQGDWDFEPSNQQVVNLKATAAMPGTTEKLDVLAERLRQGLPLWHPSDRRSYDDGEESH
jgi:hypothetical protein